MTKINFVTPYTQKPTGGLRVVNELAQQLSEKFHAGVWPNYKAKLQSGSSQATRSASLSEKAHWIVTECQLPYLNNTYDIKNCYSIFVQNPYILFNLKRFSKEKILTNLIHAKYIFCISDDAELVIKTFLPTAATVRIRWPLDIVITSYINDINDILQNKKPTITYMPRKCQAIHKLLQTKETINGYKLQPIKNLNFSELIRQLKYSTIFISLSEFEGFAAPPVEAYALGNIVVGYSGNGNEQLFRYKNFHKVEQNSYLKLIEQLEFVTAKHEHFDLEQYNTLMKKFDQKSVANYNLSKFAELNFDEHCNISDNLEYPRTNIGSIIDRVRTKFHEIRQ